MLVVFGPEAHPDAALAVVGNGPEVLERGPDGADPDVKDAVLRSEEGEAFPIRGETRAYSLGVAEQDLAGDQGYGHGFSSLRSEASQHFSVTKFSVCWALCTVDYGYG